MVWGSGFKSSVQRTSLSCMRVPTETRRIFLDDGVLELLQGEGSAPEFAGVGLLGWAKHGFGSLYLSM